MAVLKGEGLLRSKLFNKNMCMNETLPPCLGTFSTNGTVPVVLLDTLEDVKAGTTAVPLERSDWKSWQSRCAKLQHKHCEPKAALMKAGKWQSGQGVEVVYNCLPFTGRTGVRKVGNVDTACSNTLTLSSPTPFKASALKLESNYNRLFCGTAKPTLIAGLDREWLKSRMRYQIAYGKDGNPSEPKILLSYKIPGVFILS